MQALQLYEIKQPSLLWALSSQRTFFILLALLSLAKLFTLLLNLFSASAILLLQLVVSLLSDYCVYLPNLKKIYHAICKI